jgi:DNA-directed RNA polymerase specialized sigma24 family protein
MLDSPDERSETLELINQFQAGDENSAAVLFQRYMQRLTALARVRLSRKLSQRIDPDDIVMSAWRSFFVGARDAKFSIKDADDLWSLLVTITLRKLYRQTDRHFAATRSVAREETPNGALDFPLPELSAGPSPDAVVETSDLVESLMTHLTQQQRMALELRLQGATFDEVSTELEVHERTVRRWFERIKDLIRQAEFLPRKPTSETSPIEWASTEIRPDNSKLEPEFNECELLTDKDYTLKKHIGSGRTGKVFLAVHKSTGRKVAIKFLKKSFQSEPQSLARFVAEARTLMTLRHRHIVHMDGLGRAPGGGWFIVMELLEGGDLSAHIGTASISQSIEWITQACRGLQEAHKNGVVHCDIKPGNLLLDRNGNVKICDFGLARRESHLMTPSISGTPAFMAPEQVAECWGQIGFATDVYALGATLFTLLTGRMVFEEKHALDVLGMVVSRTLPPSVRSLRKDCSKAIDQICHQCLSNEPNRRPSLGTLLESLMSIET